MPSSPQEQSSKPRPGRGRRSEAAVREDALDAAAELLLSAGLAGFTLEKVARSSGVSRVTLNKYWASRGSLALDSYLHQSREHLGFPDTGDIVADLIRTLSSWANHLADPAQHRVFTQLIGTAQSDPELAQAFDSHYFGPRRLEALAMVQRAVDRGQIGPDASPATIVDMLWGACYHRLLLPNLTGTLTEGFITDLVSTALRGAGTENLRATH